MIIHFTNKSSTASSHVFCQDLNHFCCPSFFKIPSDSDGVTIFLKKGYRILDFWFWGRSQTTFTKGVGGWVQEMSTLLN